MPLKRDPSLIPLSHDHHHGLVRVFEIRQALRRDDGLEEQATATRAHWESELAAHFAAEEQVLFPAMAGLQSSAALIARLLDEHARLRRMIAELTADADHLAAFADLLEAHIRAEERELFAQYQATVPAETRERVGVEVGRMLNRDGTAAAACSLPTRR